MKAIEHEQNDWIHVLKSKFSINTGLYKEVNINIYIYIKEHSIDEQSGCHCKLKF